MSSWSAKRRFAYGGSVIIIVALVLSGIAWKILNRAPTCSDGKKNGDEKEIDCGGSCKLICTSDALSPIVLWSNVFNVSGDLYIATAYIQNPNINSRNPKADYKFQIFDNNNKLIATKVGLTSIPKNQKFAVFETGIILKGVKPKSAEFQFTALSQWEKVTEKEPDVSLHYGTLLATSTQPRVEGTITNNYLNTIPQIELAVLIMDNKENVLATSRTFVDNLLKGTSQDFVFSWPKPFDFDPSVVSVIFRQI